MREVCRVTMSFTADEAVSEARIAVVWRLCTGRYEQITLGRLSAKGDFAARSGLTYQKVAFFGVLVVVNRSIVGRRGHYCSEY